MKPNPEYKITVRLTRTQYEHLLKEAAYRRTTKSQIVRELINNDKNKEPSSNPDHL